MAATRAQVHAVDTGPSPIERYRSLLGKEAWSQFASAMRAFAVKLRGRVVWNVNSAGRGGGVAELLAALIPYDRSVGVDERWLVIDGTPEFFQVTKRVHMLAPCIDAFSTKNQDMDGHTVAEILRASGILSGSDGEATFLRNDGTAGRVRRRADLTAPLPTDARIVVQVSRWDRLKDPSGVTRGFAQHVAPHVDSWLVLAGPTVTSVDDDPEQSEILREVRDVRDGLDSRVRDRILITQLPMDDTEENAAIVNALQRRADVVVQKSLAEGFGLTVAEAMRTGRPVVAR